MTPFENKQHERLLFLRQEVESVSFKGGDIAQGLALHELLTSINFNLDPRPQDLEILSHIYSLTIEMASQLLEETNLQIENLPQLEVAILLLSDLGLNAPLELVGKAHEILRSMSSKGTDYRTLKSDTRVIAYPKIYEIYTKFAYGLDLYGAAFGYTTTPDDVLLIQYLTQGMVYVNVIFPHEVMTLNTVGKNRVNPEAGYLTIDFAGYTLAYKKIEVNGPYSGSYTAYSGPYRVNGTDASCPYSRVIETEEE